ncbi:hypothetical protein [Brevibacillus sp. DP1.3A]|uniref:hypothetical protein n=1 Tax=Brevibacillus sp. DP1.3A TaxID=2738867 RepID=UPI00156AE951|nr:hypothetical protein [Brevibacillus sp. DP1.3A]UED75567.1 hypothetical protein HP399_003425 [Brevibacillus sp. DP1.3A]
MKILLREQELMIDISKIENASNVLSVIESFVTKNSLVFCGLKINGEEIYDHFENVIMNNLDRIDTIEPIVITEDQLRHETLESVRDYTVRSLVILPALVEEFYSGAPSENTWLQLGQLIEGLQWIQKASEYLNNNLTFTQELETLDQAIRQHDTVMIGDIIEYELIPRFEVIQKNLEGIVRDEGFKR